MQIIRQEREQEEQRQRQATIEREKREREEEEAKMKQEASQEVQERLLAQLKEIEARKAREQEQELCKICQESLFTEEGGQVFALGVCSDVYHSQCILPWLKTCIENQQLPVVCPEPRCKKPIPLPDLRELLTPEEMDRCQKFEWKKIRDQNADIRECPTENCDYFFVKENDNQSYLSCPICGVEYCLKCDIVYHVQQTCEEVQEAIIGAKADKINNHSLPVDAQLLEWARAAGAKQCAQCKFWVQKNDGCDHMTCRCGYEFCYICGIKYGEC